MDLITKIVLLSDNPLTSIVWADGLLEFFQKFFKWVDQENLDPEDYCGGSYDIQFIIGDEGDWSGLNPGDVIAAAYETMSLWHDGGKGYELLSLLGMHYSPGPMGEGEEPGVKEIIEDILEPHFQAGGHV